MSGEDFSLWEKEFETPIYDQLVLDFGEPW